MTKHPAVFGEVAAVEVSRLLDSYVSDRLGTRVGAVLFEAGAVGAVFGLRLEDGREVVVKAYQRDADFDRLVEVTRCQAILIVGDSQAPRSFGRQVSTRAFPS